MLCTVRLVLSLLPSAAQTFQAPNSQKTDQPAGRGASKPLVKRIRISGDVAKSQLKHKVQPHFPQEVRDARIQGTVRLHVVLSTAGNVQQMEIVSGDPILAKAAADAVRHWKYKPMRLNGESVEVDTTVDVVFSLAY